MSRTARKPEKRPNIFSYHDYRLCLTDWFAFRKHSSPGFSIRSLSKKSGLAVGYLSMVLAGRRKFSEKARQKVIRHLGFNGTERAYFEQLVKLADSESSQAREAAFERIQKFGGYQKKNPKEIEAYRYLNHWFYVVIREMAGMPDFQLDPHWIQKKMNVKVTLNQIKEAVEFLLENGYLERVGVGRVRLPKKQVDCVGGVYRIALGSFHREMLGLAADAIENVPREHRSITGHTMAIPEEAFQEATEILNRALEKISKLGEKQSSADRVYHFALAAFPLSHK